jgi:thioredoxin 1
MGMMDSFLPHDSAMPAARQTGTDTGKRKSVIPLADADPSFEQVVLQSDRPVLIKFTSQHCPPCKALAPIVERIADESLGRCHVFSVDVDEAPRLATRYGIRAVPTLLAFKNGAPKGQLVGLVTRAAILNLLG